MFNLGAAEIGVLLLIGLALIGPDRMPTIVREVGRSYRKFRAGVSGVSAQLREESGLDIDELRSFHPRQLLDMSDDESVAPSASNEVRPTPTGAGPERRQRGAHD